MTEFLVVVAVVSVFAWAVWELLPREDADWRGVASMLA